MNSIRMNRRALLAAAAVLAAGAAAPGLALAGTGFGSTRRTAHGRETSRTEFLMGTFVAATVRDESADRAQEALEAAFTEVRRLCAVFDRRVEGTEAHTLNRAGRLAKAHPELAAVADRAVRAYRLTDGAFDPTVLPVLELLEAGVRPDGSLDVDRVELARALRLVDGSGLRVEGRDVRLERAGMAATLDGVAKGYIVDRACEAMAATGVAGCLVNAGGDVRCMGHEPWTVAVEDPAGHANYPAVVSLRNAAMATSGGYERPLGRSGMNHVLNPASGLSPAQAVSVSAVAATAMEADALSTAVYVMPPKTGVRLIDGLAGRECLVLAADGARLASMGWRGLERA